MRSRLRSRLLELVLASACLTTIVLSSSLSDALTARRAKPKELDERVFVPTPRAARLLAGGYNELGADLAWSRTLVYYGDSILNGKSFSDLEPLVALINALDPHFRRPYAWSAHASAFRVGEIPQSAYWASTRILDRAVRAFPQDWEFAWALGLRYYMDLQPREAHMRRKLKELGVTWLERAMRMPQAPSNLANLAVSLRTKLGQTEAATRNLQEMILATDDPAMREMLLTKYQKLVGEDSAQALAEAGRVFKEEWQRELPYAPDALFTIIGPPAPPLRLESLASAEALRDVLIVEDGDGRASQEADTTTGDQVP
jgi:hypothetical protein